MPKHAHMQLFGFFLSHKVTKVRCRFIRLMHSAAEEAERIHRFEMGLHSKEFFPVTISKLGRYKARLFVCTFICIAYTKYTTKHKIKKDDNDSYEMLQISSEIAYTPFSVPSTEDFIDKKQKEEAASLMYKIISSINIELSNRPSPIVGESTKGLENLFTIYEGIFVESIGQKNYNNEIKERLKVRIFSHIWSGFNTMIKISQSRSISQVLFKNELGLPRLSSP